MKAQEKEYLEMGRCLSKPSKINKDKLLIVLADGNPDIRMMTITVYRGHSASDTKAVAEQIEKKWNAYSCNCPR